MAKRNDKRAGLVVRAYREADRDALIELWQSCGLTRAWNDPDQDIALARATASAKIFVGERGGALVAGLCAGHDGHRGWIYYMAVDPRLQRRGYGAELLRHAEARLAADGVPKVQLLVRENNLAVKTFYARLGYQPNDCHIMERWLVERDAPRIETERDDGRLDVTITYLEMTQRPPHPHVVPPHKLRVSLQRAKEPTTRFYRFLYDNVGAPWL